MTKIMKRIQKLKSGLRQWAYSNVMPWIDRIRATNAIRKLQKRKADTKQPIKVGFVVQMPEIWNKEAPIYEAMTRDPRFEPRLIVVPSCSMVTWQRGEYGEELKYFTAKYPEAKPLTTKELGADFEALPEQGFSYIFFQRCWEAYIPSSLRTRRVIHYAKTCYVPYDFHLGTPLPDYYDMRFYSYLYVMFCSNDGDLKWYHPKRPRRSVSIGYPSLANLSYVDPPKRRLRILWTPRWVIEQSTFFAYKDLLLAFKREHPEFEIVMRPHPLTFENAIRTGKMTEAEVAQYKEACRDCGIAFDKNADIADSLQEADILLSDFSSILAEAASLGIPIVYTGRKEDVDPNEVMRRIAEAAYDAGDWETVKHRIIDLARGIDPKLEARKALADDLAAANHDAVSSIMDYLSRD